MSTLTVSIESKPGFPEEEIWVPVLINNATDIKSYTFDVIFDPNFADCTGIKKEETLSKDFLLVDWNLIEPGKARIGGTAFTAASIQGKGTLILLGFKIKTFLGTNPEIRLDQLKDDITNAIVENGKIIPGETLIWQWKLSD